MRSFVFDLSMGVTMGYNGLESVQNERVKSNLFFTSNLKCVSFKDKINTFYMFLFTIKKMIFSGKHATNAAESQ